MTPMQTRGLVVVLASLLLIALGVVAVVFAMRREDRRGWWQSWRVALLDVLAGGGATCVIGGVCGVYLGVQAMAI